MFVVIPPLPVIFDQTGAEGETTGVVRGRSDVDGEAEVDTGGEEEAETKGDVEIVAVTDGEADMDGDDEGDGGGSPGVRLGVLLNDVDGVALADADDEGLVEGLADELGSGWSSTWRRQCTVTVNSSKLPKECAFKSSMTIKSQLPEILVSLQNATVINVHLFKPSPLVSP
jgi:hypothetical protein